MTRAHLHRVVFGELSSPQRFVHFASTQCFVVVAHHQNTLLFFARKKQQNNNNEQMENVLFVFTTVEFLFHRLSQ
jgi:hypothetical protein